MSWPLKPAPSLGLTMRLHFRPQHLVLVSARDERGAVCEDPGWAKPVRGHVDPQALTGDPPAPPRQGLIVKRATVRYEFGTDRIRIP